MYQLHIGGPQRSGKNTLAAGLVRHLAPDKVILVDVDETRVGIFGADLPDAPIGSPENKRRQGCAYDALFGLRIPDVLGAGGHAVVTATHSHAGHYARAQALSVRFGSRLYYFLLEPCSLEECARRAAADSASRSDMTDLSDPTQRRVYEETAARFLAAYPKPVVDAGYPFIRWIQQGTPEEMLDRAISIIRE